MIFTNVKRVVIKIGSALLIEKTDSTIRSSWMRAICKNVATLKKDRLDVVIVSSGAIGVGRDVLRLTSTKLKLEEKQAAAAAGQIRLAHAWQEALAEHKISVAQILLTPSDTEERRKHLNARNTIEALLELDAVPIINENDTVATDEIRFGDNDRLAARVSQMIGADMLILLSDIDGLYSADPNKYSDASFIPEVSELTEEIFTMAGNASPGNSSGGMVTKLAAAEIAMRAGCQVIIADGRAEHSLLKLGKKNNRFTRFLPIETPSNARKRWIAASVSHAGAIIIDRGAEQALKSGGSLLPAGVSSIQGNFDRGDTVIICGKSGHRVGCGISAYSAKDTSLILGQKSCEIEKLLGYRGRDEIIHRDNLVLDEKTFDMHANE